MFGLDAEEKLEVLERLVANNSTIAHNTLAHVLYSSACTCDTDTNLPFTYNFCPIAGDPEFLRTNGIDMSNFNPERSKYK